MSGGKGVHVTAVTQITNIGTLFLSRKGFLVKYSWFLLADTQI